VIDTFVAVMDDLLRFPEETVSISILVAEKISENHGDEAISYRGCLVTIHRRNLDSDRMRILQKGCNLPLMIICNKFLRLKSKADLTHRLEAVELWRL
jgi:hypothetical protein